MAPPGPEGAVAVSVRGLSGDVVEVARPGDSVAELRERIAEHWSVLPPCVRLVLGTELLLDGEELGARLREAGGEVLALVTPDSVARDLEEGTWRQRRDALRTIGGWGPRGGHAAVAAASARLEDIDADVRREAVETLTKVSEGSSGSIASVCQFLRHDEYEVRLTALEAVVRLAARGNQFCVAAICACLDSDDDSTVRRKAVRALRMMAEPGDPLALAALRARLGDEDADVMREAAAALADLGGACACTLQ